MSEQGTFFKAVAEKLNGFTGLKTFKMTAYGVALMIFSSWALWIFLTSFETSTSAGLEQSSAILAYIIGIPIALLSSFVAIILAINSHQLAVSQDKTNNVLLKLEVNNFVPKLYTDTSQLYINLIKELTSIATTQIRLIDIYTGLISENETGRKLAKFDSNSTEEPVEDPDKFFDEQRKKINKEISSDRDLQSVYSLLKSHISNLTKTLILINENSLSRTIWKKSFSNARLQKESLSIPNQVVLDNQTEHFSRKTPSIEFSSILSVVTFLKYMSLQSSIDTVLNSAPLNKHFEYVYTMVYKNHHNDDCMVLDSRPYRIEPYASHITPLLEAADSLFFGYTQKYLGKGKSFLTFDYHPGQELFINLLHHIPNSNEIKNAIEEHVAPLGITGAGPNTTNIANTSLRMLDNFEKNEFFLFKENNEAELIEKVNSLEEAIAKFNNDLLNINR